MVDLKLKNNNGDILEFSDDSPFSIDEITGLDPPDAIVNRNNVASLDGTKYNSSKVNERTINISFTIDTEPEKNRLDIYKVLKSKHFVEVIFNGAYRKVSIAGTVESINIDYFAMPQLVSVSILCTFPFFKDLQEMINNIDSVVPMFYFPFSITKENPIPFGYIDTVTNITVINEGEITCGMEIELYARSTVRNPKIFNYITGEYIGLDFNMIAGDSIFITTHSGNKNITLLRQGKNINILNSLMRGSEWLQLENGENTFTFDAEYGLTSLHITFKHTQLYQGV